MGIITRTNLPQIAEEFLLAPKVAEDTPHFRLEVVDDLHHHTDNGRDADQLVEQMGAPCIEFCKKQRSRRSTAATLVNASGAHRGGEASTQVLRPLYRLLQRL